MTGWDPNVNIMQMFCDVFVEDKKPDSNFHRDCNAILLFTSRKNLDFCFIFWMIFMVRCLSYLKSMSVIVYILVHAVTFIIKNWIIG